MENNVEMTTVTNNAEQPVPAKPTETVLETEVDGGILSPSGKPAPLALKPGKNRPLDINLYTTKKTVAQGMMDLSLLTANSNQLRYVLTIGASGSYFVSSVVLISMSIILQLSVAIGLILLGRYKISPFHHNGFADRLNNWILLGILLTTVVNIFISAFAIQQNEDPNSIIDAYKESLRTVNEVSSH